MNRILLVEDDPDVGPLLEHMLFSAGYQVTKAASVAEAHRLLDQRAHDLVLTDVNLPDGSGVAVADTAKLLGVKTLLITGYALQLRPDETARHEYLMKPVRAPELLAVVARVLGAPGG